MALTATDELDIPVPDYVDRFLAILAKKTETTKEDVALFFLFQEAGHALRVESPSQLGRGVPVKPKKGKHV